MADIDRDLILHWALDRISDSRVADLAGMTNHGTPIGTPSVVPDPIFGACLRLDGGSDAVKLGTMLDFPESELSVCLWVKSTATNAKGTLLSYATDDHHNAFTLFDHRNVSVYLGNRFERDTGVSSSDGQWHHIAVCWRSGDGQIVLYRDGAEAHRDTLAPGARIRSGGSLMLGQDQDSPSGNTASAQAFRGELAHLRIYRRVLRPSEVEQLMLADVARVPPTAATGPDGDPFLSFQLLDRNRNNAVYLAPSGDEQSLTLEIASSRRVTLKKQRKVTPTAENCHFELLFRPEVLAEISLEKTQAERDRWALASVKEPDGVVRVFVLSRVARTIEPDRKLEIELRYRSAASRAGSRATRVALRYQFLQAAEEKTLRRGFLSAPLRLVDLRDETRLPLRAGFAGGNTILNLGADYPNTLTIELVNSAMARTLNFSPLGSDAPTRLVLSADAQPPEQQRDWALGTIDEVAAIEADIDDPRWNIEASQLGESPEWIFTPTEAIAFGPGEKITLTLENVVSSLPEGSATFYLRYEHIGGSTDGQFELPVIKSSESIRDLPLTGGGMVAWGGADGRLRWSKPFLLYGRSNPTVFGDGSVEITMPVLGAIPADHVHDNQPRSVNPEGILLRGWEALYAVHDQGRGATTLSFRIIDHTKPFRAAGNWRLLAAVDPQDRTVRLGNGVTLAPGSASSAGSPIPVGAITMWSGSIDRIPAGWALCDGQNGTPDLRDRFLVGAGAAYAVGAIGGANAVTLNPNEMPVHAHGASSGAAGDHSHWIEGTDADGLAKRQRRIWGETTVDMGFGGGWNRDPNDERWRGAVNTDNAGTHAHSIAVDPAGGSQPHENRPPYYALAFLMKL